MKPTVRQRRIQLYQLSSLILLHTLWNLCPRLWESQPVTLEQERFLLTEPLWVRNNLEYYIPSQFVGAGRKGEEINECVLKVPGWNFKCIFLQKYFGLWCLVSVALKYCNLQVHCGLNAFLWAYLVSWLPCNSIGQFVSEFRITDLWTSCQKVRDYVCRKGN